MHWGESLTIRRGFGPAFFLTVILTCFPVAAFCSEPGMFARFESRLFSEPESIKNTIDDWGGDFGRGKRQWGVGYMGVGVRNGGVEISAFARALIDFRFNSDAAVFFGKISREERLRSGESVPVSFKSNSFSGKGLRLGYVRELGSTSFSIGASVIHARHLVAGTLNGSFSAPTESSFSFDADVDYNFYRDFLFDRKDAANPHGWGLGFDFSSSWKFSDDWLLTVEADDLFARIVWDDAPRTVARATTDQERVSGQGFTQLDPLLSGTEGFDDFTQKLDARYAASVDWEPGLWSLHLRGRHQFGYGIIGAGAGYRFTSGLSVRAVHWARIDSLELELDWRRWRASLSLDNVKVDDVHAFTIGISYAY